MACLKGRNISENRSKTIGQAQLLTLAVLLFLLPTAVIIAQNATNSTLPLEGMAISIDTNVTPAQETTGTHSVEGAAFEGNTTPENNMIETLENPAPENVTMPEEITIPENATQPEPVVNETNQQTSPLSENETTPRVNITPEQQEENETVAPPLVENLTTSPVFQSSITTPGRVIRGEGTTLTLELVNTGGKAENVVVEWELPHFLETAYNTKQDLGVIEPGSTVHTSITVLSRKDSTLGAASVKARVTYG